MSCGADSPPLRVCAHAGRALAQPWQVGGGARIGFHKRVQILAPRAIDGGQSRLAHRVSILAYRPGLGAVGAGFGAAGVGAGARAGPVVPTTRLLSPLVMTP